jgi:hypothetical protein
MSLYDYLRLPEQEREAIEKQERQERASQKVDLWCQEVRDYAQGVGEMQRKYNQPAGGNE